MMSNNFFGSTQQGNSNNSSAMFPNAPGGNIQDTQSALERELTRYQLQQLQQQISNAPKGGSLVPNTSTSNFLLHASSASAARGGNINTMPGPSTAALPGHRLEQRLDHSSLMHGQSMFGSSMIPNHGSGTGAYDQSLLASPLGWPSTGEGQLLINLQQQQQQQQSQEYLQSFAGASSTSLAALATSQHQSNLNQQYSALLFGKEKGTALASSQQKPPSSFGGSIEPFPEKLHRLLTEVEAIGGSEIISWADNGKAFVIHKPDRFFRDIVPLYFRQSRLSSFKRQLNLYGFELINDGDRPDARGGYSHEHFVRDKPEWCRRMRRVNVHSQAKKGTTTTTTATINEDGEQSESKSKETKSET